MQAKTKQLLLEAFNALMCALIVLPVLVVVQKVFLAEAAPWSGVALLSPVAVCWPLGRWLRSKDKQLALSIGVVLSALLSIPLIAVNAANLEFFGIVVLVLAATACGIITFIIPFIYGPFIPGGKFFVGGLIFYVLAISLGGEHAASYSPVLNTCAVVLLIVTLFVYNIIGLMQATSPTGGRARMPKGMRRSNMVILAVFVVLAIALANIRAIKDAAVAAGLWVVDRVYDFLLWAANLTGAPTPEGNATYGDGGVDLSELAGPVPELNPFHELLWKIFLYIIIFLMIVVLCYLLYRIIRKLIGRFGGLFDRLLGRLQPIEDDYIDETEDIEEEKGEREGNFFERLRRRFTRRAKFGDMPSPRAKVRFAMREFLRENPSKRALTPDELLPEFAEVTPDDAAAFADAYERARYTDGEISEKDVDAARHLLEWL